MRVQELMRGWGTVSDLDDIDVVFLIMARWSPVAFLKFSNFFDTGAAKYMYQAKIDGVQLDWNDAINSTWITRTTPEINNLLASINKVVARFNFVPTYHKVNVNGVDYLAPSSDEPSARILFNMLAITTSDDQTQAVFDSIKAHNGLSKILFDSNYATKLNHLATRSDLFKAVQAVKTVLSVHFEDSFFCWAGGLLVYMDEVLQADLSSFDCGKYEQELQDIVVMEVNNTNCVDFDCQPGDDRPTLKNRYVEARLWEVTVGYNHTVADVAKHAPKTPTTLEDSSEYALTNSTIAAMTHLTKTLLNGNMVLATTVMSGATDFIHDLGYNHVDNYCNVLAGKAKVKPICYIMGKNRSTRFQNLLLSDANEVRICRSDDSTFDNVTSGKNLTVLKTEEAYVADVLASPISKCLIVDSAPSQLHRTPRGAYVVEGNDHKSFKNAVRPLSVLYNKSLAQTPDEFHANLPNKMVLRFQPFIEKDARLVESFFNVMVHHYHIKVYSPYNANSTIFTLVMTLRRAMLPKQHDKSEVFLKLFARHVLTVLTNRYSYLTGVINGRYSIMSFNPFRGALRMWGMDKKGKNYRLPSLVDYANWTEGTIFCAISNTLTDVSAVAVDSDRRKYLGTSYVRNAAQNRNAKYGSKLNASNATFLESLGSIDEKPKPHDGGSFRPNVKSKVKKKKSDGGGLYTNKNKFYKETPLVSEYPPPNLGR